MRQILFLSLMILSMACAEQPKDSVNETIIFSETEDKIVQVAAALRMDPDTKQWFFIDDAQHRPLNLDKVETDPNGTAHVYFSFNSSKIIAFICSPDESFAHKGLHCGASVGTDMARIEFSMTPEDMALHGHNVFIMGIFEL